MDTFYVYAYLDLDGTPFYIGKGCGPRRDKHFWLCRQEATKNDCRDFYAKLRETLDAGTRPKRIIVLENLPLTAARTWEKAFIDDIGRLDLGTGPLTNLKSGTRLSQKTIERIAKAKQARDKLATPEEKQERGRTISKGQAKMTPEEKQKWKENIAAGIAKMTPEEKLQQAEAQSKSQISQWAALAPEEKKNRSKTMSNAQNRTEVKRRKSKATAAHFAALTPEEKKQNSKAMRAGHANMTPEERKHKVKTAAETAAAKTPEEKQREYENRSRGQKARQAKLKEKID